jgi:hypothetical protein
MSTGCAGNSWQHSRGNLPGGTASHSRRSLDLHRIELLLGSTSHIFLCVSQSQDLRHQPVRTAWLGNLLDSTVLCHTRVRPRDDGFTVLAGARVMG